MCCVSDIKKSSTTKHALASKQKIDLIFHLVSRADAGSANLGMTHRDKAKYSCAHLPQQTEQVNTVTWLYITVSARGWDALIRRGICDVLNQAYVQRDMCYVLYCVGSHV